MINFVELAATISPDKDVLDALSNKYLTGNKTVQACD